jgi:xanthine dehydrogenase large subunit
MNAPHAPFDVRTTSIVGAPVPHDSAPLHVAGAAHYTDDLPEPFGTLYAAIGTSEQAHGRIERVDLDAVRASEGVVALITATDIPGMNDVGPIVADDPIFAERVVQFAGQPIFAVAATSVNAARRAVECARLDVEPLPAILTIDEALAAESYVLPPVHVVRGDPQRALAPPPHRLRGHFENGGHENI